MIINEERYGIHVRNVDLNDAEFLFNLRSDKYLTRFISQFEGSLEDQKEWIRKYKEREDAGTEWYFMFLYNGERQGVARLYKIEQDHFTQGSWLFKPDAIAGCSILGNIISSEIGFELPNKEYELTDARKGNRTHRWVKTFNPEFLYETDLDIFYKITKENFNKAKIKHIELCKKVMSLEHKI